MKGKQLKLLMITLATMIMKIDTHDTYGYEGEFSDPSSEEDFASEEELEDEIVKYIVECIREGLPYFKSYLKFIVRELIREEMQDNDD